MTPAVAAEPAPLAPAATGAHRTSPASGQHAVHPAAWLVGAGLYALSWPVTPLDLSVLAWVAFVPLLLDVERHDRFGPYAWRVLAFMGLAGVVSCWWWFFAVPEPVRMLAWVGGAHEIVLSAVPLLALYPLKRALGYARALWALVLVWPLWEWAYNHWELSISSILVGYTQAANVWLVQFADLFGVWAVTAWVVLFNVLLARAYRQLGWSRAFGQRALVVAGILLVVPLAYAGVRAATVEPDGAFDVTAIHTDFDPLVNPDGGLRISRATHLTDSVAYFAPEPPDLYVWPESGVPYAWTAESRPFLRRAVADWDTPLLTGYNGRRAVAAGDSAGFNQAVLLEPGAEGPEPAYTKRRLVPVREGLPHAELFGSIPAIARRSESLDWTEPGREPTLLPVQTADAAEVQVATPICHEQQFPGLWAEWTREGADVFVLLSFDSWFGDGAFSDHFLHIVRIRAIETRRSVVRVSNGGPTAVVDAFGRVEARAEGDEGALQATVAIHPGRTLYARAPWLFPLGCALGLGVLLVRGRRRA